MSGEALYMQRALELAQLGLGKVSPNPMVGCVIVHKDKIIGEGYHETYGHAHAEVNAIESVEDDSSLKESTAYVTLEPCSHHGKTPPCADLFIEKGIYKIVIAAKDPFLPVNGKGISKLEKAGIKVEVGLLREESENLNKRFNTFHLKKRPYVILKWAETVDGFIARENYDSKWISNSQSRQLVHKWRTEEDAVLVGKNTALYDNPSLTAREWNGLNPKRILLDRLLEIPSGHNLFDQEADTIVLNAQKAETKKNITWRKLDSWSPNDILQQLSELNIQSVIIEGGAQVLNSFIENNCWDEARVFSSNEKFEKGIAAPKLDVDFNKEIKIDGDHLHFYCNTNG